MEHEHSLIERMEAVNKNAQEATFAEITIIMNQIQREG